MTLRGIIPPVVTPMLPNEDLDLPRLCVLIDHLISMGVHGIFVLGTTGECYALDEDEKQQVIAAAIKHVHGRVPVYAGTGAETTREAIRITKMAYREGIDGVSVITPYFISPNQSEIADHYRRIAEAVPVPLILYNNPATTGNVRIEPETVARLAEIPNIIGIKDSTGDLQNLCEMVRVVPATFSVLQGRDTLIYQGLMSGAKGAIPTTSNLAPDYCVGIYESVSRGDYETALAIQWRLNPIRIGMALGTPPGTIKAALTLMGQSAGPSRLPIAPLSLEKQVVLQRILREAGLISG